MQARIERRTVKPPARAGKGGEPRALHDALVEQLKGMGCIRSPGVEDAFRAVPRHLFLPGVELERVYSDDAILTKRLGGEVVSSSSQPAIMAIMLEQLDLKPGQRVLEIGAGTGYNAALMAHLVGDSGQVVTIDIDQDLVNGAREHLAAAGLDRVRVVCGDGDLGYAGGAPYDRIILSVGAGDIVPAWWAQLRPGGRLVLPLEIVGGVQKSVAFERLDDHMESFSVKDCGFMNLRGAFARRAKSIELGPTPGITMYADSDRRLDPGTIYRLLAGPYKDRTTNVRATIGDVVFGGLAVWLGVREQDLCSLHAEGEAADRGVVPCFMEYTGDWRSCSTRGLVREDTLSVFVCPRASPAAAERSDQSPEFDLTVGSYGPSDGEALGDHVIAWDSAGRPANEGLHIRAYLHEADYVASPNEIVVHKERTKLVLHWS